MASAYYDQGGDQQWDEPFAELSENPFAGDLPSWEFEQGADEQYEAPPTIEEQPEPTPIETLSDIVAEWNEPEPELVTATTMADPQGYDRVDEVNWNEFTPEPEAFFSEPSTEIPMDEWDYDYGSEDWSSGEVSYDDSWYWGGDETEDNSGSVGDEWYWGGEESGNGDVETVDGSVGDEWYWGEEPTMTDGTYDENSGFYSGVFDGYDPNEPVYFDGNPSGIDWSQYGPAEDDSWYSNDWARTTDGELVMVNENGEAVDQWGEVLDGVEIRDPYSVGMPDDIYGGIGFEPMQTASGSGPAQANATSNRPNDPAAQRTGGGGSAGSPASIGNNSSSRPSSTPGQQPTQNRTVVAQRTLPDGRQEVRYSDGTTAIIGTARTNTTGVVTAASGNRAATTSTGGVGGLLNSIFGTPVTTVNPQTGQRTTTTQGGLLGTVASVANAFQPARPGTIQTSTRGGVVTAGRVGSTVNPAASVQPGRSQLTPAKPAASGFTISPTIAIVAGVGVLALVIISRKR